MSLKKIINFMKKISNIFTNAQKSKKIKECLKKIFQNAYETETVKLIITKLQKNMKDQKKPNLFIETKPYIGDLVDRYLPNLGPAIGISSVSNL